VTDKLRLVRAEALAQSVPYAYASVVAHGAVVFTAGACPLDDAGEVVHRGDPVQQARVAVANLVVALRAADCSLADVAKSTVYVASADRADLVAVWQVVRDAFGNHDAPSTLLGVAALGYDGQLVEIEAVAVLPS
jgi:enamine deaminase RidA (YjgF/YER057c/UK114 family)